jgi:tetratricopeptide (TPR) repeat protein
MKRVTATHILILLVPILLALHTLSNRQVHGFRNSIRYQNTLRAPLLPKEVLTIVAGEFKGLLADFLMLEISAFIDAGEEKSEEDWKRIIYHFSQIMALDPYFSQTYRMVQAFLPWKGHVEPANELLEVARQHLTWDWYPGFFIGFNYFNELKDYAKASKYLLEASKMEGAPPLLATLGSRLAQESGQTVTAIAFLKTMLKNPDNDDVARKMLSMRLEVLEGVLLLERAIKVYENQLGRPIERLEDLVTSGILSQLPEHGESGSYGYEEGRVVF